MIFSSNYPKPIRLDRLLRSCFGKVAQSLIEKSCRKKNIVLNGEKVRPNFLVHKKDVICVKNLSLVSQISKCDHSHTGSELVVYEEKDFCVIYKPYGLPSQGGPGIYDSVAHKFSSPYRLVHRLDRNTEGLMILAKNRQAASDFMEKFRNKTIIKHYLAVLKGHPEKASGIIQLPLINTCIDGEDRVEVDFKNGKESITRYRVVKRLNKFHTLVCLKPHTGRKHQLRVHMASLGTPILGDSKYGVRAQRMYLFAYKLSVGGKTFFKLPSFF